MSAGELWFCNVCGGANAAAAAACAHCGDPYGTLDVHAPAVGEFRLPRSTRAGTHKLAVAIVVLCIVVNVILWRVWIRQEHDVIGHVSDARWTHEVVRETFVPTVVQGWRRDVFEAPPVMPVEGRGGRGGVQNVRNCRNEIHHHKQYACGTHNVCRTYSRRESCGSDRTCTGVGKNRRCASRTRYCDKSYEECRDEIKYCSEPVYESRCDYDTWIWQESQTRELSGEGAEVRWPEVPLGPLDRTHQRGEYEVTIEYEHEGHRRRYTFPVQELETFERWARASRVRVRLDNAGELKSVSRFDDDEP